MMEEAPAMFALGAVSSFARVEFCGNSETFFSVKVAPTSCEEGAALSFIGGYLRQVPLKRYLRIEGWTQIYGENAF